MKRSRRNFAEGLCHQLTGGGGGDAALEVAGELDHLGRNREGAGRRDASQHGRGGLGGTVDV